ncbi:MAG: Type 1 glutamine amidotransferase-like domain-containing protein [Pseudomonadota bacterium]|nr:Type 1 glutamine amidotransferase-like domain-containing protein [Pseudomonadota bacterium]
MNLLLLSSWRYFSPDLHRIFDRPLKDLDVVRIPTAAFGHNTQEWLEPEKAWLQGHMKSFADFDLRGKMVDEVRQALAEADIIYVTGGNTYFLLEHVQKSGFAKVLKECLNRGAWYMSASAGSILACPDIDHIRPMNDPSCARLDDTKGLGLVPFLIMPHTDQPAFATLTQKIAREQHQTILGLRDDQVLCIRDGYVEVLQQRQS